MVHNFLGYGVFATTDFVKGQFLLEYAGNFSIYIYYFKGRKFHDFVIDIYNIYIYTLFDDTYILEKPPKFRFYPLKFLPLNY